MEIIREEVHPKMVKNRQKESALDQTADSSYDYKEGKISPWKSNKDDQTVDSDSKSKTFGQITTTKPMNGEANQKNGEK